jgi:predicted MFS family arabinose efflux permease
MQAFRRSLPVGAFLVLLPGYGAGALGGSAVAARLPSAPERQAKVVAVLLLAGSILNLFALPHPAWFWVANIAIVILGAWAGGRLGTPVPPSPSPG